MHAELQGAARSPEPACVSQRLSDEENTELEFEPEPEPEPV